MPKSRPKYQLYRIDWLDAFSAGNGWNAIDAVPNMTMLIHSSGWLIKENKNYIILAQSLSENKNYSDTINIPKIWIKKKVKLKNWIEYELEDTKK